MSLAVTAWWLLLRVVRPLPAAAHPAGRGQPGSGDALSLTARVLFIQREDDVVTLDCVVACTGVTASMPMPEGMPFTILAELPVTERWAAETTESILAIWAAQSTAVDVDIFDGARGPAVRMSDASTRVQLGMAA
jgi:hypothetical protein